MLEKAKRIQGQNDSKDIEAKRHMIEKAKIEALIEKHRLRTLKTPDEVNKMGTGKNAKDKGQEGTVKGKPPYKKATKDIQIKKSCKKGTEAVNAEKGKQDTLLGNPVANTTTGIEKAKEKGQKDKIGIDDIGIFEFIFKGLPELPELEGVDEDRLRELQNAVQEQLCKRDEERERNITKRVQAFKKTFDFVNSHLLKGVATMAELTKSDSRQHMGKIKPIDKMVMMPSLFVSMKPAKSKQHYERFNLYINFQTKSGHLTDPVKEGIDLFEHTLDKTALVWFQMNKSKFKDLTMLKMIFLQRYNPWGKTKREQLQSWNILSFNPKTTDVDEHIDLINTLGDMVDQKEEAKKEKFIETMPTMIQTHLITCKDWATVKDTAKSLEHIIMKCDPPTPAMPTMVTGATVLGLYSHIAHSVDKEEGDIPQPFKGAKPKQTRGRGKPKGKPQEQRQNPPKVQEVDDTYTYESPNNYYHNAPSESRGCRPYNGQSRNQQFRGFIRRNRGQRPQYSQRQFQTYRYQRSAPQQNRTQYGSAHKSYFQGNQMNIYRGQGRGPQQFRGCGCSRSNFQNNAGTYQYQYYTHDQQSEQYGPPCSLCGGFNQSPKHCYKGEHDINNIMEKMSINPHQSQQSSLYQ